MMLKANLHEPKGALLKGSALSMPMPSGSADKQGFYVTGGTLGLDAPSYVERQCDLDLLEALLKGESCYLLTSRQMGKSSLMVRTTRKLRERGIAVIVWDLTAIGQNLTAEQWYDGLCVRMGEQLGLEDDLEEFWKDKPQLSPVQRLFAALRDVVLPKLRPEPRQPAASSQQPVSGIQPSRAKGCLVVFVDEIDVVRSLPFSTDEFFAAIRECYNRRTEDPAFERVTFCLLGVATPSDLIQDTRMTPFNIGRRIELHDFKLAEATPLARGLESPSVGAHQAKRLLARILYWTRGHPYLTQRLCQAVAEAPNRRTGTPAACIDPLCEELFFSARARERDDNLLFVRERLLRSATDLPGLLHLCDEVLRGGRVRDDETNPLVSVLRLSGIVRHQEGRLLWRNRIYERAFGRAWVSAHMPDAELRRQQAAYYRGVARTTAIAAVVVAAMTVMILIAASQAQRAREALARSNLSQAQAYVSQTQAARRSERAGQRLESLKALRAAHAYYTNEAILRDEVIACLALLDLRETTEIHSPKPAGVFDLNLDSGVSATGEEDGTITLRSLDGQQVLKTLPASGRRVTRLRFGPREPVLVAEYAAPAAVETIVWDWSAGRRLFSLPHAIHGRAIDFSADGRKLAIGQDSGLVAVYSLPQGTTLNVAQLKLKSGRPRVPHALRFSPSADWLAESSLDDLLVQVWGLDSHSPQLPLMSLYHRAEVDDIGWHPRGELLATACADSCVYVWNTNRHDRAKKLAGHEGRVTAVAFNHRGTLIASVGLDETIRLWSPATDRQMAGPLNGESFDRLEFSAGDERLLAMGPGETSPRLWEVFGGEYVALHVLGSPLGDWRGIDFSPDGRWFAAVSGQRALLWDAETGRESGVLNFGNARAAWFSADSGHLLASTDEGLFRGRVAYQGQGQGPQPFSGVIDRLQQATNELEAMAVTQDRSLAAIVHRDEVLLVPLAPSHDPAPRVVPVSVHYHRLALHPTGRWMAAMVTGSSAVHLRDFSEEVKPPPPTVLPSSEYFAFSPDGRWLVTCWAGRYEFYPVGAWQKPTLRILRQPGSDQHAPVAFTQDGSIIALAFSRYTIQLRRLSGKDQTEPPLLATLAAPDRSPLEMLAFSPDGRRLAAATADQTIQLWNLKSLRAGLAELNLHHDWPEYP